MWWFQKATTTGSNSKMTDNPGKLGSQVTSIALASNMHFVSEKTSSTVYNFVLALIGFDVSCTCYSEYLSPRGYDAF